MRISDWSSDVCSSDLRAFFGRGDFTQAGNRRPYASRNSTIRPVGSLAFMTIAKSARQPRLVPYGYTLAILTVLNAFNFLDRQIITLLAEPIKAEFKLADWQIGMMTGLSFALLYCIAGFPIARWAERGARIRLLSLAVIV